MLKADLHIHSAEDPQDKGFAYDAKGIIDRAAQHGFNAIAITLHNKVLDTTLLSGYAREQGITLIPGCEAEIEGRHVLLYNITEEERRGLRTFDDIRRLRTRRGNGLLVIAAHPCLPHKNSLGETLVRRHADCFDAVELSQYSYVLFDFNKRSARLARALGKPLVAGSDAHSMRFFGKVATLVGSDNTVQAIFDAIRAGATKPLAPRLSTRDFIHVVRKIGWMRLREMAGLDGDFIF